MIEIPEAFARTTIEQKGERGRAWVAALPGLLDEFLRRWRCTPTAPLRHGACGITLVVRRDDGRPAVLKISFPHPRRVHEPDAFAAWRGRGAVRLYERDDASVAMLLEQGGHETLAHLGDHDGATAVLGQLARRLAVQAPPHLPRLSHRARHWERTLRRGAWRWGQPLSRQAMRAAIATIQDLGHHQPDTLVHGDLHFGNVVRAEREPWLVIDPKGWVGDPAYDALNVLLGGVQSLRTATDLGTVLRRRLTLFADAAEIEPERAMRWVQARTAIRAQRGRRLRNSAWVIQLQERVAELLA